MKFISRTALNHSVLSLFVVFGLSMVPMASAGTNKAMLIGIEQYEKPGVSELEYVGNDIRLLTEVLSTRCEFEVKQIIDSAIDGDTERIGPTTHRDAMMREIEQWVDSFNDGDTAIIYVSSHGFVDEEGHLYLAMINCDRTDPVPGGIPVAWLRDQFSKCKATYKLLLIDACHAGNSKSLKSQHATAKDIEVALRKIEGVVTIASCQGSQQSWLWDEKRQSLFTYWLAEAIKGHADTKRDGQITLDEIAEFITPQVENVASEILHQSQTPVIFGSFDTTKPFALKLKPISLQRQIDYLADQIDVLMRLCNLKSVAIPEFAVGMLEKDSSLTNDYGALPAYLAQALREKLAMKSGQSRSYRVIGETETRELLNNSNIYPKDIGGSKTVGLVAKSKAIQESLPVEAIVSGRIVNRNGAQLHLDCHLFDTNWQGEVGSAGGHAFLNESEFAMLGYNVQPPHQQKPPTDTTENDNSSNSQTTNYPPNTDSPIEQQTPEEAIIARVEALDEQSDRICPMVGSKFPFKVEVRVKESTDIYETRPFLFMDNQCYVALDRGEVYQIAVKVELDSPVFARILVDGLNTLPQRMPTEPKGVGIVPRTTTKSQVAPRVNLAEARAWLLKPSGSWIKFNGFVHETGRGGVAREFKVFDAPESLAGRQGYTEQLGQITVACYNPEPKQSRKVATGEGESYSGDFIHYQGDSVPGQMLGAITIRYISQEEMDKLLSPH